MTGDTTVPAGDTTPTRSSRFRRLKQFALVFAFLLLATATARWWWGHTADERLQAALDKYRAAGQPVLIEDFACEPIPDDRNAAVALRDAAAAVVARDEVTDNDERAPAWGEYLGRPALLREHERALAAAIKENAEALRLAREARAREQAVWYTRLTSPLINMLLPHLSGQRTLTKLLADTAAFEHHVERDDAAAIGRVRDMLAQADHLREAEPCVITDLVCGAIDAMAYQTIESITPGLAVAPPTDDSETPRTPAPREDVEAIITTLLDEASLPASTQRGFYGERLMQMDTWQQLERGGLSVGGIMGGGATPTGGAGPRLSATAFYLFGPMFTLDLVRMMDWTTEYAEAAAQPTWPAAEASMPAIGGPPGGVQRLTRLLSSIMMPSLERAIQIGFRQRAFRRMTAVALAIRLYETDHGQRPATLDDLVPQYLPAVPPDPFHVDAAPLRYLPENDPPLLYSVGPNAKDDRGLYVLQTDGDVDWEQVDMPFFLNGDRPRASLRQPVPSGPDSPRAPETQPTTGPTTQP